MLKQFVSVDATILDAYAHLIYTVTFYADGTETRPRFSFRIPQGAVISHLQIIQGEHSTVSKIAPWTPQTEHTPVGIVRQSEDEYILTADILPEAGTITAVIIAYAPLNLLKNGARLVIPNPYIQAGINIKVMENVERKSTVFSPTHSVQKYNDVYKITSDMFSRDILIDVLYGESRESVGYITHTNDDENIGYFRLKLPKRKREEIGVLFILDSSMEMIGNRFAKAKDGILSALQSFSPEQKFNVVAISKDALYFSDSMQSCSTENLRALSDWLKKTEISIGTTQDGFKALAKTFEKGDILPIFVTSPESSAWSPIVRYNRNLAGCGMGIITLGNVSPHRAITAAADFFGGYTRHILDLDNFGEAFARAAEDIISASVYRYKLLPDFDGEAYLCNEGIFGGDFLSFLVKFHGRVHTEFSVGTEKDIMRINVENITSIPDFDLIKILYGEASIKKQRSILYKTTPVSYKRILKQIQYDALKYGVLTEETALEIKKSDGSGIPYYIQIEKALPDRELTKDKSRFLAPVTDEKIIFSPKTAASVLLENLRSNGAITNSEVFDTVLLQTSYALIALSIYLCDKKKYAPIIADTTEFLKSFPSYNKGIVTFAISCGEAFSAAKKIAPPPAFYQISSYDQIIMAANYILRMK